MKKFNYLILPALLLTFVLLGQGCVSDQQNQSENMQNTNTSSVQDQIKKDIEKAAEKTDKEKNSELKLTAESRGEGKVYFEWETSKEIDPQKFVIVRDEKVDPVHNGNNYWFRQPGERRSVTWINIPSGNYHFRICTIENGECVQYSNNVQVEVK